MKTKAKLLLAISTLSAVVLAAGVTSTFAWFTTQTTAKLSTGNLTVSSVSDIKMDVTKLAYTVNDDGSAIEKISAATDYTDTAPQAMGLVSSVDGLAFYAPTALNSTGTFTATNMDEVTTENAWGYSGNEYVGYLKYGLHVYAPKDSGTSKEMKYKFAVTNTAGDGDPDSGIKASYRVAFYETDASWENEEFIGIYSATARKIKVGEVEQHDNEGWYYDTSELTKKTKQYETTVLPTSATSFDTAVTTENPIDRYYVVSIWLEGADAAAINALGGKTFKASVEFSLV